MNFEVAAGSVLGREHRKTGKNNQDAYAIHEDVHKIIAVVCDGCGSARSSEVGSNIGSRLIVQALNSHLLMSGSVKEALEKTRQDVLRNIKDLAIGMGDDLCQTILDYFLFTVVGIVVTSEKTVIFSIGDGFYAFNGNVCRIGPFPNNAPPYMTYDLIREFLDPNASKFDQFKIDLTMPTEDLVSCLIATDGLSDLILSQAKPIQGTDKLVDSLTQFWQDDRYFQNRDMVRRHLALVGKDHVLCDNNTSSIVKSLGYLSDDTTLIAIRRKKEV
jgi:serine/threonine protein phosphatase PrpC